MFEPHRRHCVVSLSKNINPSLVLVQPRKTRPFITERLLMGRKELNQTNKNKIIEYFAVTGLAQEPRDLVNELPFKVSSVIPLDPITILYSVA